MPLLGDLRAFYGMLTSFSALAQARGAISFLDSRKDYIALFPVYQPQIVLCGSITLSYNAILHRVIVSELNLSGEIYLIY